MRFPGFNVENPVLLSRHLTNAIKGVNWLTILSDEFLNKLGGLEKIQGQLDDNFPFYYYHGGGLIQSGTSPQIGDRNRKNIPKYYQQLGLVLKPVRVDYPDTFLGAPLDLGVDAQEKKMNGLPALIKSY
jgi:hypothetical protein